MPRAALLRPALKYAAVLLAGLGLVVAASVGGQTQGDLTGLTGSTVVATLGSGGARHSEAVLAALASARQNPQDRLAARAAARILIDEGRNAGDSRLVGAALGVLRPFLAEPDAQTLYLAATARQYQHDFPGALDLLDRAERLDPAEVNVILTRATVRIVLGQFDRAAADCERLSELARPDLGFLCQAMNRLLTADAPQIAVGLAEVLARPGVLDPALHGWARGLMGEIAALHGDPAEAKRHFVAVLAENPLALRERLLLCDLLLAEGQATEALALLAPAIAADGVLVRRVLAARATGDTGLAATVEAELAARFSQNIALGLTAHAREETLYYLHVAHDPDMALQRALVNWDLQHEIEDARMLVEAAVLAGQPQAAAPVVRWMVAQSVDVPTFQVAQAVREAAR